MENGNETIEAPAQNVVGETLTCKLPSGFEVTIRETNGEDDDIISKVANAEDGSSLNKFLAAIIIKGPDGENFVGENTIMHWKLKDKYALLLKSRLHSLGGELNFTYTCAEKKCQKETPLEEDLTQYDWDLNKPSLNEDHPDYFPSRVTPYPHGAETERKITLTSGRIVKYKYLTGLGEKKALDLGQANLSKNSELLIRDVKVYKTSLEGKVADDKVASDDKAWLRVDNFKLFTAKEMMQIRADVKKNDAQFEMLSTVHCGHCGESQELPLITEPSFFFPDEM